MARALFSQLTRIVRLLAAWPCGAPVTIDHNRHRTGRAAAGMGAAVWPRINVSLQAVAQVLLCIGLGMWLSARHNFDRKALAAVSELNWHVLIPALMVSSWHGLSSLTPPPHTHTPA